jgi:tRNA dimethylallyltransferase
VTEVEGLYQAGVSTLSTSMQAIGYKEIVWYLEGLVSLDEAVERIKMETRRYAKRQLTWFRRDPRINWMDITDISMGEAARKICDHIGRTWGRFVELL